MSDWGKSTSDNAVLVDKDELMALEAKAAAFDGSYLELLFENMETVRVPLDYVIEFEFAEDVDSEGSSQYYVQLSEYGANILMEDTGWGRITLSERIRQHNDVDCFRYLENTNVIISRIINWTEDSDEFGVNNGAFYSELKEGGIVIGAGEEYRKLFGLEE